MHFSQSIFFNRVFFFTLFVSLLVVGKAQTAEDVVGYVGDQGNDRFYESLQLSDGSYLVCGSSQREEWMLTLPLIDLSISPDLNNTKTSEERFGFILHLSQDCKTVLQLARFSKGLVDNIKQMRLDASGNLYISGDLAFNIDETAYDEGYFISKLNNNFVSGNPTGMEWAIQVVARNELLEKHAWDVTSDGRVVYAEGSPFSNEDLRIQRLNASGNGNQIVENWRSHSGQSKSFGTPVDFIASNAYNNSSYATVDSYIEISTASCELRSWSSSEFDELSTDQAGNPRKGHWPLDNLYSQPCDTSNPFVSSAGPGVSLATEGNLKIGHVADIKIDHATDRIYMGLTFQVIKNTTDFRYESYVVCMEDDGSLAWWSRLHSAPSSPNSTSFLIKALSVNGERDELAILAEISEDLSFGHWTNDQLSNGNGQESVLNAILANTSVATWVAKFDSENGSAKSSTYLAGLTDNGLSTSPPLENATGWANPNAGNPVFSPCEAGKNIAIDDQGQLFFTIQTEGWPTTDNAYQQQSTLPQTGSDMTSYGSYGVVLNPELTSLTYCSMLTGEWSRTSNNGSNNTVLWNFAPGSNSGLLTGWHISANDASNAPIGNLIPFNFQEHTLGNSQPSTLPSYATQAIGASTKDNAIIAQLAFEKTISAQFSSSPSQGVCIGETVSFSDLSFASSGIASWQWNFDQGSSPNSGSNSSPTVFWSTTGTKSIQLIITDNNNQTDTANLQLEILAIGQPSFTYVGQVDSVPSTLTFTADQSLTGQSHFWQISDSTGTIFTTSTQASFDFTFDCASPSGSTYIVEHTLSNGKCDSTSSQEITITGNNEFPSAIFSTNGAIIQSGGGCVGDVFTFEHTANANITSWDWFFGEGSSPLSSFEQGPHQVQYETPGTKTLYLVVSDGSQTHRYEVTLEISGGESSAFKFFGDTTTAPTILAFQSSINNGSDYFWDFGNPFDTALSQGSGRLINMQFEIPGFYAVTHEVNTGVNCKLIQKRIIEVGNITNGPSADFYFSPSSGACVNNEVVIHEVSDAGHLINSSNFVWDFGEDAVPQTYTGYSPPPVSWTSSGEKVVTLMVNNQVLRSKFYQVYGAPEGAFSIDYSQSDCSGGLPHNVWLAPSGANNGSSYVWDMDSEANPGTLVSTSSFPNASFTESREYAVEFKETNAGCSAAMVNKLNITAAGCAIASSSAGISISGPGEGCNQAVHTVTSTSTGTVLNYTWTGINAVGPGPHTVFGLTSGTEITLEILDNFGDTDSVTITVP